jgi:general secretion pathway protein G
VPSRTGFLPSGVPQAEVVRGRSFIPRPDQARKSALIVYTFMQIAASTTFPLRMTSSGRTESGFTLIELIVATTILIILTGMAIPMARITIKREKERELRHALWEMRDAIDRYKDAADRQAFQIKVGSEGYPPDLDTLVNGVDVGGKKLKFLRRIPIDPMSGNTDWGLRAMQDDPASDSWNGENVFDVYTKSQGTALDGTKYKDW